MNVMMRILKFGGKSLSSTQKTQKICKYIKKIYEKDKKIIVIVSAMGNTTNELIEKSAIFKPEKFAKRELDVLLSTGETMSASLMAMALQKCSVPAKSFQSWQIKINTHGDHQNSLITSIDKSKLDMCLESNTVAVITGFQGINKNDDITTLGRGGSDTTACALGAIYNTNVELYSDFNGIFSCDPRECESKKINQVSLNQLERVSNSGSKLVTPRAVKLAKKNNFNFPIVILVDLSLSSVSRSYHFPLRQPGSRCTRKYRVSFRPGGISHPGARPDSDSHSRARI